MDFSTINETLDKLKLKKISILELSKIFIDRIKKNSDINVFYLF